MPNTRSVTTEKTEREARYRNWDGLNEHDDHESNAYVDLIQKDPVVCDSCFLFRYDVVACEWWRGSFGWMDYVNWESRPDANVAIPREDPSQGMQLVCKNCGHGSAEKERPIPSHLIDEYVENLSSTLRMKGIDHDREVLIDTVQNKNDSDNQGRQDSHVFAPAVERAIRHA